MNSTDALQKKPCSFELKIYHFFSFVMLMKECGRNPFEPNITGNGWWDEYRKWYKRGWE